VVIPFVVLDADPFVVLATVVETLIEPELYPVVAKLPDPTWNR
jgi:hypothetical protein